MSNPSPVSKINGTVVAVALVIGLILALVTVALIVVFRPDASATVITFAGTFLSVLVGFGTLVLGLNRIGAAVEQVQKQTNGLNTALAAKVTGIAPSVIETLKSGDATAIAQIPVHTISPTVATTTTGGTLPTVPVNNLSNTPQITQNGYNMPTAPDGSTYTTDEGLNARPADVNHPDNLPNVAPSSDPAAVSPTATAGPEVQTPNGSDEVVDPATITPVTDPAPTTEETGDVVHNADGTVTIDGVTYRKDVTETSTTVSPSSNLLAEQHTAE